MGKLAIYYASYPREGYDPSPTIALLEKAGHTVLHPSYNWKKVTPQVSVLMEKKGVDIPSYWGWDGAIERDLAGLRAVDLMVYDLDCHAPGEYHLHFITSACILGIPVVVSSATLQPLPLYFSGYVKAILKPTDLVKLEVMYGPDSQVGPTVDSASPSSTDEPVPLIGADNNL